MDEGHYDLIGVFAKSQQDFPIGIGVKHSLFVKQRVLGKKKLEFCTRNELSQLIWALRKEYKWMEEKLRNQDANVS